ncbi:malonyl CoA-acyl carrier protein transacylase [Spirochaetia bacterium]|nr:malonyl CoA-acyl carrier protein transacylase [Spirochaetia bacterium]
MALSGKKTVFLFPGQGAQYQGMALDLWEVSAGVKKLFAQLSEIYGKDMKTFLADADADTLKRTDVSQPAITLANLSAAAYLAEQGVEPSAVAGFSLGEYAALTTAGLISAEDCFRLVKARGEAMQASADRLKQLGGEAPGMAAVVGLAPATVESLIAEWTANGLKDIYAANINSPKQVVVSGRAASLTEAENRFKEAGARRVIRLQVAGPFHSPLIADAAAKFKPVLEAVSFNAPRIPLYSNVTGKKISSGDEAKKLALLQITCPVRWTDVEASINNNIDTALETGPGKVLQGLWKDSGSEIPCLAAGTLEDIKSCV